MKRLALIALALLATACDSTHHARLDDGAGLAEGAPVIVSSVRVGQVEGVRVIEGSVDVEFSIDDAHEVTLRQDACALARRTEAGSELVVLPGTGAMLEEDRPIGQCRLDEGNVGDLLRTLGEGMSDMLRQLTEGMLGGQRASPPQPAPPPPLPPPPP